MEKGIVSTLLYLFGIQLQEQECACEVAVNSGEFVSQSCEKLLGG